METREAEKLADLEALARRAVSLAFSGYSLEDRAELAKVMKQLQSKLRELDELRAK